MSLMGYVTSQFRDFESCLRIKVGLVEDDIQLIIKQYDTNFITYQTYQAFTQSKKFQRSSILWVIIK